ncbi:MAG: DUF805 domain-containing protein [Bacteroidales bacterium]|jgi:uncharacterized membrane protein YhaH (DUF805 family)
MNYIKEAVTKKYAQFSGRARRKEYWTYTLVVFIISLIAGLIDDFIIKKAIISTIITLALIVPSFAIAVRRLHDIGKGGGWVFICLIPIVGAIWFLVLMATPGEVGENRFGEDPKADERFENTENTENTESN